MLEKILLQQNISIFGDTNCRIRKAHVLFEFFHFVLKYLFLKVFNTNTTENILISYMYVYVFERIRFQNSTLIFNLLLVNYLNLFVTLIYGKKSDSFNDKDSLNTMKSRLQSESFNESEIFQQKKKVKVLMEFQKKFQ